LRIRARYPLEAVRRDGSADGGYVPCATRLPVTLSSITLTTPNGAYWDFLVVFLAIVIGPPLVRRARVPGLIGLLLAGYAIGPNGLNLIQAGNGTVPEMGDLGLLYLMFVAGVEMDLRMLRHDRRAAVIHGVTAFALPMAFGVVVGLGLGWSTPAALLLGSLLASHTLLLYTSVRNAGFGADPAVPASVGATVITDTLSLVVLACVAGFETDTGTIAGSAAQVAVGLVVLVAFTFGLLPHLVRVAFRYLGTDRSVRYVLALAAFLAAATVAEVFGIEGIVGAFFAGMAVNRLVPNEGPLMDRIEFFGSAVFIPVFLLSVGLLIDPGVLVDPETLRLAGLFVVACIGGKALAAWLSRYTLGYTRTQSAIAFALSAPQAATTLAATIVGYDIGLFDESVVNAVLVLILVSIVAGTVVLARAERSAPHTPPAPAHLGSRILVAIADGAQAATAYAIATRVAAPDGGVVHARYARALGEHEEVDADLAALATAGHSLGVDTEPRLLVHGALAEAVVHEAVVERSTLVLVGASDEDWSRSLGVAGGDGSALPVAVLSGSVDTIARVRLIAGEDRDRDGVSAQLARRISSTDVVPETAAGWRETLAPGDLAIVAAAPWDALADTAAPPPTGAAVLTLMAG
jgi:Kef-type K+ transport system membrane component KefB